MACALPVGLLDVRRGVSRAGGLMGLLGGMLSGCTPAPASAEMFVALAGRPEAAGILEVLDEGGSAVSFDLRGDDGVLRRAEGPTPVPCRPSAGGVNCTASLVIDPGSYRFVLAVTERDRCGVSAVTVQLSSGPEPVVIERGANAALALRVTRADFDDDRDGIVNALERAVCGRFDVADDALPPQSCSAPDDPCCQAPGSPLEGQRGVFNGGSHALADGDLVELSPFVLDATEVTWGTLARCVAAGACLRDAPAHPLRQALDNPAVDRHAPVVGLLPREASELCAWRGGRLPDDDEWDFAAAHRASGVRARYPFDIKPVAGVIECSPGATGAGANYAAHGRDCPEDPVAVGSYPSSLRMSYRGSPLADLAGNAFEWTVVRATSEVGDVPEDFPDGAEALVLRGGAVGSIIELLENDVSVRVLRTSPDVGERLSTLSAVAGVRCAFDVDEGAAFEEAAEVRTEPPCEGE
jgi:formylglycine-generating enzyme required for sulfatase activity